MQKCSRALIIAAESFQWMARWRASFTVTDAVVVSTRWATSSTCRPWSPSHHPGGGRWKSPLPPPWEPGMLLRMPVGNLKPLWIDCDRQLFKCYSVEFRNLCYISLFHQFYLSLVILWNKSAFKRKEWLKLKFNVLLISGQFSLPEGARTFQRMASMPGPSWPPTRGENRVRETGSWKSGTEPA